jgi:hypothetical protein
MYEEPPINKHESLWKRLTTMIIFCWSCLINLVKHCTVKSSHVAWYGQPDDRKNETAYTDQDTQDPLNDQGAVEQVCKVPEKRSLGL